MTSLTRLTGTALRRVRAAMGEPPPADGEVGLLIAGPSGDTERWAVILSRLIERRNRDERLIELLLEEIEPNLVASPTPTGRR